ncbi:hypothetical protein GKE82_19620 [Conexibacter sp. W3-3-2]|uniref:Alkaline phosphatase family protein n=1 Tax=Paraconexibacter algicola TaxID=2133960 RepID=A0A2T4ULG9_9ACTN|nr:MULTISPECIES: alkaline phosphatase family protein [Solirubrobacterales]MTD46434.1 hypothetical protein [Conexibacter sp. W3-3-2]PTL60086.1 hypothetical protein C7Y72_10735 [Paraconexibacter algicola]
MARLLLPLLAVLALVALAVGVPPDRSGPRSADAQGQGPQDDATRPLVYVFSFDATDGDRAIDQGRAPFLASMVRGEEGARSTYYRDSRGIMVSETNPNHTAMATGAYGERSGIPGNTFAVYDEAARRTCPAEGGDPNGPMVTSGEASTCLLAETFFAALKRQAPDVVTAGIFGKPKLGRIFSTRTVDPQAYDADHLWAPCEGSSDDPPYCRSVAVDPVQRYTNDVVVMDEVLRTVREGVPADGATRRPNLTFVNFPTIDQLGHFTGAGPVYETAIGNADQQLRRFVAQQKQLGLWDRTTIFVVSDHSMDTTTKLAPNAIASSFGADADAVEIVLNGSVNMVYLKDRNRPDRDALLARLRAAALTNPRVDEALYRLPNAADGDTRHTLDGVHPGWKIAGERTGDLLVTAKPTEKFGDGIPGGINPLSGNHGAPQTLDHMFAIVGGDPRIRQQAIASEKVDPVRFSDTVENPGSSEQVDVAPTVMALFGSRPPAQAQGRVLDEAFSSLPRVAGSCTVPTALRGFAVLPDGRGVRVTLPRTAGTTFAVDVFRQSAGRRAIANAPAARFRRSASFRWDGRGALDGSYLVRVRALRGTTTVDTRRIALVRRAGRFVGAAAPEAPRSCGTIAKAKLDRTAFGGTRGTALRVSLRLNRDARVRVELRDARDRVVRTLGDRTRRAGATQRLTVRAAGLRPGTYLVRIRATAGGRTVTRNLGATRL